MAAYNWKGKAFTFDDFNRMLAIVDACIKLCQINFIEIAKKSQSNKDYTMLKEFNDLLFTIDILADINEEIIWNNLQSFYRFEKEKDFALLYEHLSDKSNLYKSSNNIRMYNESQAALYKLLYEEHKRVIDQLNSIKNLFENQLLLFNKKIQQLNDNINEKNVSAKRIFSDAINIENLNLSHIGKLSIADEIIEYSTHVLLEKIQIRVEFEIDNDNLTESIMNTIFNDEMYTFFLENIKKSKNFFYFTETEIHNTIMTAVEDFKQILKNELSNTKFYEILLEKKNLLEEKALNYASKSIVAEKISDIQQTENRLSDYKNQIDNNMNIANLDEVVQSLAQAKSIILTSQDINFTHENNPDPYDIDRGEDELFLVDEKEESDESITSKITSQPSAPGGAPIIFDDSNHDALPPVESKARFESESQFQPQPIKPSNSTLSLYQKLGIRNPGSMPKQEPNENQEAKQPEKINSSANASSLHAKNDLPNDKEEPDQSGPRFRR